MIELIENDSGDWAVLKLNDKIFFEGHTIPDFIWLELIEKIKPGIDTSVKTVTDEEMEQGIY